MRIASTNERATEGVARRLRTRSARVTALACLLLATAPAFAVIIPRTIAVDGVVTDWGAVDQNSDGDTADAGEASIITNDGQFSTDPRGSAADCSTPPQAGEDGDCEIQATGRDLKYFAFTFDDDYLYMYVERYASTSNKTDWWFYIDTDADGRLETGEKVLRVEWRGSNRSTDRTLYDYVADDGALGDPLTSGGSADGYDMPGTTGDDLDLDDVDGDLSGGSSSGLEMETRVRWSDLETGATGPFSIGFHISSSNGPNIPQQLDDNMDGPDGGDGGGGSLFSFSDPAITKTGPAVGVGTRPILFTLTLTNVDGPDAAEGIEVTDDCTQLEIVDRDPPFGDTLLAGESFTYFDHDASAGTYDDGTGVWSVPSLAVGASATLELECVVTNVEPMEIRNTAEITGLDNIDLELGDNEDSADPLIVEPAPDITMIKSSTVTRDPVNGGSFPKRIPGACLTYTVQVVNSGPGRSTNLELQDLLPAGTVLYTGDFEEGATECGGNGTTAPTDSPVQFQPLDSGLGFSFVSLSDGNDSLEFQDSGGSSITPDGGFDADVARLVIRPTGTFLGQCCGNGTTDGDHEFQLMFRVRLE
jgi:uncharacterized repeat protein (TIGR01451 family)